MANKFLFQLQVSDEQFQNWVPLECSVNEPENCVPTALALSGVMARDTAQTVSRTIEKGGMDLRYVTTTLLNFLPTTKVQLVINVSLPNIIDVIQQHLLPGYITIIGIESTKLRHITLIAKNLNGDILIFEGQTSVVYMGEAVYNYLKAFHNFYYWTTSDRIKRKLSDLLDYREKINPQDFEEPTLKKKRGDDFNGEIVKMDISTGGKFINKRRTKIRRTKIRRTKIRRTKTKRTKTKRTKTRRTKTIRTRR